MKGPFAKKADEVLRTYRGSSRMLQSFVQELLEAVVGRTRMTREMLDDVRRVLRGEPQIHDKPDPDDPDGEFGFVVTKKRDIRLLAEVLGREADARSQQHAMLYEMAFMYLISLFDAFLRDLFMTALIYRPAMLRSKKQITYEKILELRAKPEIVAYMAEREMLEVGFRSIREQLAYFATKFGVDVERSGIRVAELEEIYARRNLLAHNNGIVNSVYREHAPRSRVALNKRLTVSDKYWNRAVKSLDVVAQYATTQLKAKMGRRGARAPNCCKKLMAGRLPRPAAEPPRSAARRTASRRLQTRPADLSLVAASAVPLTAASTRGLATAYATDVRRMSNVP